MLRENFELRSIPEHVAQRPATESGE
jgi:hypothetical protein